MTSRLVRGGCAFILYAGTVLWLTWPLGSNLATGLVNGDENDPLLIAWSLSHQSRALVTDPLNMTDARIFHPAPSSLLHGGAGFGAVPYFMPTFLLSGNPALALNVMMLTCISLTALTLHLIVAGWTGSYVAAVVSGMTFVTTPSVLWNWWLGGSTPRGQPWPLAGPLGLGSRGAPGLPCSATSRAVRRDRGSATRGA